MTITVYKGFKEDFLKNIDGEPLVANSCEQKLNVLLFSKKYRKELEMALLNLEDNDSRWITYEEYTLIKNRIDDALYDVMRYESMRIMEDYERKFQIAKEQYFSMSCKLRRQSYITRRYIVRDYLIKRLQGKAVAIRGAGGHTDEIIRILSDSPVNIICIWDKNTKGEVYGGYPVVRNASDSLMYSTDAVLISSWKYREEMKEDVESELETINLKDVEIIEFYSELQQKGIPIDSEYFWFDWDFDV